MKSPKELEDHIRDELNNPSSPWYSFISSLDHNEIVEFATSILNKDAANLEKMLSRMTTHPDFPPSELSQLVNLSLEKTNSSTPGINPVAWSVFVSAFRTYIDNQDALEKKNTGDHLEPSDINSILADTFLTPILRNVPDDNLSLSDKRQLIKNMGRLFGVPLKDMRAAYVEFIPPYQDSINKDGKKVAATGIVNAKQYEEIMQHAIKNNEKMDSSQFILLTMGLYQDYFEQAKANPNSTDMEEFEFELEALKGSYRALRLDDCLYLLKDMSDSLKRKGVMSDETFNLIQSANQSLIEENSNNFSRRFFENRLAGRYIAENLGSKEMLDSVNKFMKAKMDDHKPAENGTDVVNFMTRVSEVHDHRSMGLTNNLKQENDFDKIREKRFKEGFQPKVFELDRPSKEQIYSQNLGTMKSIQPNYASELSQHAIRNPTVDVRHHATMQDGYTNQVNYVSGLSGHAYAFIANVLTWLDDNPGLSEEEKNADANRLLEAFCIANISAGVHGLTEISNILSFSNIQDEFEKRDVILNVKWDQNVIDQSIKDSQEYALQMAQKTMIHADIAAIKKQDAEQAAEQPLVHENENTLENDDKDELSSESENDSDSDSEDELSSESENDSDSDSENDSDSDSEDELSHDMATIVHAFVMETNDVMDRCSQLKMEDAVMDAMSVKDSASMMTYMVKNDPSCNGEELKALCSKMQGMLDEMMRSFDFSKKDKDEFSNLKQSLTMIERNIEGLKKYSADAFLKTYPDLIQKVYESQNRMAALSANDPAFNQAKKEFNDAVANCSNYMNNCMEFHEDQKNIRDFMMELCEKDESIPLIMYIATGNNDLKEAVNIVDPDDLCSMQEKNLEVYPVHFAAMCNNDKAMGLMINRGADFNRESNFLKTSDGAKATPLSIAVSNDHAGVLKTLVDKGAKVTDGDVASCRSGETKKLVGSQAEKQNEESDLRVSVNLGH